MPSRRRSSRTPMSVISARRVSSRFFPFHYGQPDDVKEAYEEAMGFKMEDPRAPEGRY